MPSDTWQVWEQYAYDDQRLVGEFDTFGEACDLFRSYGSEAVDQNVVITKNNSTEY